MPMESRAPTVRSDGLSEPRQTALAIRYLLEKIINTLDTLAETNSRLAFLETAVMDLTVRVTALETLP